MQTIIVEDSANERIDSYLMNNTEYTRSKIQKMLKNGDIKVNGSSVKNSYSVRLGDTIEIKEVEPEEMHAEPEEMDLNIIYEDDDVIVVNKDNGVVVHPAIGNNHGTLVNGLLYHSKTLSFIVLMLIQLVY